MGEAENSKAPSAGKKAHGGKAKPAKPTRTDRSKRLLDLVMLLLKARIPVSYRTIREGFPSYQTQNDEAGLRAFERDKADLLELGIPIRYITPDEDESVDEGGYVVEAKRYRLPEVHLTTDEVSALVLAGSMARAVPGVSYSKIVDLALRKLSFDAPELPDTPVELPVTKSSNLPVLVHFPSMPAKDSRQLGDRFVRLEAATRNRKKVTLRYQSASTGYIQTRDVDPYGLAYRDGSWLLVGYCHLRSEVRSFRLDRISDLKIAPKPKSPDFVRPPDFDLRGYANRSPWTFQTSAAEDVVLEFAAEVASVAGEDFGRDATVERADDGTVRVSFPCGNPDYALSRILVGKGGIRVLKGKQLKKRLVEELKTIESLYLENKLENKLEQKKSGKHK